MYRQSPSPSCDRALPVEILGLIFLEGSHLDHGNDFLITVSHVSHYWRTTALSTPSIWWDVSVSTRWSLHTNYDKAMAWMRRSKQSPIRIRSLLRGEWPAKSADTLTPEEVEKGVDCLTSNIYRLRSFVLDNRGTTVAPKTILRTLRQASASIAKHGAPLLRDFSIYGSAPVLPHPHEIMNWPAIDFGHLPCVENLLLRSAALVEVPERARLSRNLTRFSYKRYTMLDRDAREFTGSRRLSVADVLAIIGDSPCLTHLDISDIANGVEVPAPTTVKRVVSTTLESVELSFRSAASLVHFLGRVSFSQVRHLSLDVDFEATADDARPVVIDPQLIDAPLKRLTSLHLASVCPPVISSIIHRAPNIERLWIDGLDDWPFHLAVPPIEAVIDALLCSCDAETQGSDGNGNLRAVAAGGSKMRCRLPCARIKSFCFVDCDDLFSEQVIRLVKAYVPSLDNLEACQLDAVRVCVRDKPLEATICDLQRRVRVLDLSAAKWPELDTHGFDFALIPLW